MPPVDMTPEDEEQFFRTGALPENLNMQLLSNAEDEPAEVVETPPVVEPKVEEPDRIQQLLEEQRAHNAALEARLAEFEGKLPKPAPKQEEELPDKITDPLGNIIAQLERSNSRIILLEQKLTERDSQSELRSQFDQFRANVQTLKTEFLKTTPDFDAAYQHLRAIREEDYKDSGMNAEAVRRALLEDEFRISQTAISKGQNPAEAMYKMAKRYGYAPKADVQQDKQKQAEAKVDRLANGQFASKPAGVSNAKSDLTVEGLKDASNSDLNKIVTDDKMWKQLVGGASVGDIFQH